MSIREIFRFFNTEEKIVATLIFLFPVFFLTIKGWSNTIALLLFLVALVCLILKFRFFFYGRRREFWFFNLCLSFPFFAELFVQVGRGDVVASDLDGPSRFLAAAIVFTFISKVRPNLIKYISMGAFISVLVTFASVSLFTDYYWSGRAATSFVDPITLPVYSIACLALVNPSMMTLRRQWRTSILGLIFLAYLLVGILVIISQSRTSWAPYIFLVELTLLTALDRNLKAFLCINIALLIFLYIIFSFVGSVNLRLNEVIKNLNSYLIGDGNTSVGLRLGLIEMDMKLFFAHPMFGVADGKLPPIEWFHAEGLDVSGRLYELKLLAGSHSEIFAQLARKGLLGIPTVFFLFFFPFFCFLTHMRKDTGSARNEAAMGFKFCSVIFISSLTIQVFNLKMTSTFYALTLAIFFATLLRKIENKSSDCAQSSL